MFEYGLLLVFPAFMIFAGVSDMLTMTIPNRISIILFGAFFFVAFFAGLTLEQVGMHLAVGLGVLAAGIALFSLGLCGGGDAKLLAAASLWVGFDQMLPFVVYIGVGGGLLAFAILAYRIAVPEVLAARLGWAYRLHKPASGIPYGIAIAGGALSVFPATTVFQALAG